MPEPFTFHPQDIHLLDVFAHDIRSPLLGMSGCLGELEVAITALPDPGDMSEDLADLRDGLSRVEALLDGLLTLCRRSRPPLSVEVLDMDALAAEAIEAVGGQGAITAAPLPPCRGDHAALLSALTHLLDNALRAGGPVHLTGQSGDRIEYTITDHGGGLSAAIKRQAFELFVSGEGRDGIGLSLARHHIIRHRGWLRLHPTDDGSQVVVSLPR